MIVTLDPAAAKMSFTSNRDHSSDTYDVQGLEEFAKLGRGTLVLTGPGKENDKPVDVRITLTLRRNLYTLRKETPTRAKTSNFEIPTPSLVQNLPPASKVSLSPKEPE
jgi:hypothetical protein